MIFIDLEKAHIRVLKDLILWVLDKRSVPRGDIETIKNNYKGNSECENYSWRERGYSSDHTLKNHAQNPDGINTQP